jgi:ABC-type transport system involved in multi-copper enzyme maturation permease subunit
VSGSLLRLLAAEWRKVATTKLLWILTLVSVAFSALNVVLLVLVAPGATPQLASENPLTDPGYVTNVLATASSASVFVLILGIIGMTGEYRHMTITSTFLATPRRGRVIVAKGLAYALLGAAVAIVNVVVVTALAAALMAGKDHAPIQPSTVGTVLFGVTLGLSIYAVVGVSVGALIKNQVGAIVAAIVWVLLVEGLISLFFEGVGKWLPGGALSATMDVTAKTDLTPTNLLPVWGGALVLLGYAVAFSTLAAFTTVRRDIT